MSKPSLLFSEHGGYARLRSFVVALAVYDGTVVYCERFVGRRTRTHDQMVQAARSGVQNIAEGSLAAATSRKMELTLTGVARASLGELIRDYEDQLRQRDLQLWDRDDPRVLAIRARLAGHRRPAGNRSIKHTPQPGSPFDEPLSAALLSLKTCNLQWAANILLCMAHQASFLLFRQMKRLEKDFAAHGGFSERLYRFRSEHRKRWRSDGSDGSEGSDESDRSDWTA
jgi:restriction system protein